MFEYDSNVFLKFDRSQIDKIVYNAEKSIVYKNSSFIKMDSSLLSCDRIKNMEKIIYMNPYDRENSLRIFECAEKAKTIHCYYNEGLRFNSKLRPLNLYISSLYSSPKIELESNFMKSLKNVKIKFNHKSSPAEIESLVESFPKEIETAQFWSGKIKNSTISNLLAKSKKSMQNMVLGNCNIETLDVPENNYSLLGLSMPNNIISDESLAQISKSGVMDKVILLDLSNNDIKGQRGDIKSVEFLQHINLAHNRGLKSLDFLIKKEINRLIKTLNVSGCSLSIDYVSSVISNLENVSSLFISSLDSCEEIDSFFAHVKQSSVEHLDLSHNTIETYLLHCSENITSVKSLNISNCVTSGINLSLLLDSIPNLTFLDLSWNKKVDVSTVNKYYNKIEFLDLSYTDFLIKMEIENFTKFISLFKNLKVLRLAGCGLRDDHIERVLALKFKSLQILELSENEITEKGMSYIESSTLLSSIHEINVFGNKISSEYLIRNLPINNHDLSFVLNKGLWDTQSFMNLELGVKWKNLNYVDEYSKFFIFPSIHLEPSCLSGY